MNMLAGRHRTLGQRQQGQRWRSRTWCERAFQNRVRATSQNACFAHWGSCSYLRFLKSLLRLSAAEIEGIGSVKNHASRAWLSLDALRQCDGVQAVTAGSEKPLAACFQQAFVRTRRSELVLHSKVRAGRFITFANFKCAKVRFFCLNSQVMLTFMHLKFVKVKEWAFTSSAKR
jgi:hypothetical protein